MKIKNALHIITKLGFTEFMNVMKDAIFSINYYYILARKLDRPVEFPFCRKLAGVISLAQPSDIIKIQESLSSLGQQDRRELLTRMLFYQNGFNNCYILTVNGCLACIQWLITSQENHIIAQKYAKKFYPLQGNQVMVENVFTYPKYRGFGCFLLLTTQLLETAKKMGATSAICYVRVDRISSVNDAMKMGFKINKMIKEYKIAGLVWRNLNKKR